MKLNFKIEDSVRNRIRFSAIAFANLKVQARNEPLIDEINAYCKTLQRQYQTTANALKYLQPMRELYKTIGLDPTKNRPSSEALLRRVLHGKELYQINSVVDACNYCSLFFGLSIGLYDVDKISGEVIKLRVGAVHEGYSGIGKEYVNVEGKFTLADEIGPFGNPSADSDRTKITLQTSHALYVVFAPANYDPQKLNQHLNFLEHTVKKYHDCVVDYKELF